MLRVYKDNILSELFVNGENDAEEGFIASDVSLPGGSKWNWNGGEVGLEKPPDVSDNNESSTPGCAEHQVSFL